MINKKKIDEIDLIVVNESWTEEERKSFSAFLKARKLRLGKRRKKQSAEKSIKKAFGAFKSKKGSDQIIHEVRDSRTFKRSTAKI